jgi:hypothetical protein
MAKNTKKSPKKSTKAIEPDDESERLLGEIEEQYPPEKVSLEEYRDVLKALHTDIRERIQQLDEEIG